MQTDLRLFGLDLGPVWQDVQSAWRAMRHWRIWDWLSPQPTVRVVLSDGGVQVWRAGRPVSSAREGRSNARYVAVFLPEDILLRRRIPMPSLAPAEAEQALSLDIQTSSPFPADQLLSVRRWHAVADGLSATTVLTSRSLVQAHLQAQGLNPLETEVWVSAEDEPLVVPGFGEARRLQRMRAGRWLAVALLLGCFGWLVGMAVTPTVQLRERALQAVASFDQLVARANPAVREREAAMLAQDRIGRVQELMAQDVPVLATLEMLTQAVPDESFVLTLQLQGNSVRITGQTPNAAELMKVLGSLPGVSDVKAPSPATRPPGTTKESFNIEFTFRPGDATAPQEVRS